MALRGSEGHSWTSRRNTSSMGVVSAILVRALLSALVGSMLETNRSRSTSQIRAVVRSHSTPNTSAECWLDWSSSRCGVPHGEVTKVTYHLGVLAIVQALSNPDLAGDFWQAYTGLLGAFRQYGRSGEIAEAKLPSELLCRAANELYFWLRYCPADADSSHSQLEALQIGAKQCWCLPTNLSDRHLILTYYSMDVD